LAALKSVDEVASDFDAIAHALHRSSRRDRLSQAQRELLRGIPSHARRALDVGCGDGFLARAIAGRGLDVVGIDVSPGMIALARSRTPGDLHVEYLVGDVMTEPLPVGSFDVVVTVNMVHHLPLAAIVPRLAAATAPGGTLLIQDVVTRRGIRDFPLNVVAAILLRLHRLVTGTAGRREIASLYRRHGVGEVYLRPSEVAPAYRELLPGTRIRHHLDWRYSVIWQRPGAVRHAAADLSSASHSAR
jgi:2-polyprenyl-3-methyl-5-hydroxy-6-metoxy-1,4-benzoquinol methylase